MTTFAFILPAHTLSGFSSPQLIYVHTLPVTTGETTFQLFPSVCVKKPQQPDKQQMLA